jgi:DMSO/TMAO reductase YedYZ molybdopterin-dependent catalytic subunit
MYEETKAYWRKKMKEKRDQPKVKPYLITRKVLPENQETPIHFLKDSIIPASYFYRRNHFPYPELPTTSYSVPIEGSVLKPLTFSYEGLLNLPAKTLKVVLECSGNKRSFFKPNVFGEQWEEGAVNQSYWKGVPLQTLFKYTGLRPEAKEVVFTGYDFGERKDLKETYHFARSLPISKALHPDTILAYELNGQPLSFKHGFPLRLIAPKWYAMTSVKWVKRIFVIEENFQGPFQSIDYVYVPGDGDNSRSYPVTTMNVNSTIQEPFDHSIIETGKHMIRGIAWTGEGRIEKIEISLDRGQTWLPATYDKQNNAYGWVDWSFPWNAAKSGIYSIWSRATDTKGRMQPLEAFWNRKGYGYNAICKVDVEVQ